MCAAAAHLSTTVTDWLPELTLWLHIADLRGWAVLWFGIHFGLLASKMGILMTMSLGDVSSISILVSRNNQEADVR